MTGVFGKTGISAGKYPLFSYRNGGKEAENPGNFSGMKIPGKRKNPVLREWNTAIKREIRPSEVRESAVFVNLRAYGRKKRSYGRGKLSE